MEKLLKFLKGKNFPVYILSNGKLAAWHKMGRSPYRVIICSMPKAGTYLYAKLLELLGVEFVRLHLWLTGFSDYRFASIKEGRERYKEFNIEMPLSKTLELIHPGQFAVSHLECSSLTRELLRDFKKIFVYRNFRDSLISHMRFMVDTGRDKEGTAPFRHLPDGPDKLLKYIEVYSGHFIKESKGVLGWIDQDDILKLSFEDIYGDNGEERQYKVIRDICKFLDLPPEKRNYREILIQLIGAKTLTWSGKRTDRSIFWDERVERRFAEIGGREINKKLNYE